MVYSFNGDFSMVNQDRVNEALLFAAVKHEGIKMKQPVVSYVAHLQGVCLEAVSGCLNNGSKVDLEKVMMLALLHDTIEDTGTTYEEIKEAFGEDIANGVQALTKNEDLPHEERMKDSLKRIKTQSVEVAIVKLADRLFNLKDVPLQWDEGKIYLYREEAKMILNELGFANEFMANRLKDKIGTYCL